MTETQISKLLSSVLRHEPQKVGLKLDTAGWVAVDDLLKALAAHEIPVSLAQLTWVVAQSDKQRFALSEDGTRIRANQGHSIPVELGYCPEQPPEALYHGTATRSLASILKLGLTKGKRHHVHLSLDIETARKVGQRHGEPTILLVASGQMHRDGYIFYRSTNGVWLTNNVLPQYLQQYAAV